MSRRRSGLASIETFTIKTTSTALARRFRDHCYAKGLVMSGVMEDLMADYLVAQGIVSSKESFEIEDVLTK